MTVIEYIKRQNYDSVYATLTYKDGILHDDEIGDVEIIDETVKRVVNRLFDEFCKVLGVINKTMKRIYIGIVILIMFVITGCILDPILNNEQNSTLDNSSSLVVQEETQELDENSNDCLVIYDDESNRKVEVDELKFETSMYHVASFEKKAEKILYKLELDEGEYRPQKKLNLTVIEVELPKFNGLNDARNYISDEFGLMDSITIYYEIIDESEVTNFYVVEQNDNFIYIVSYGESSYLVESDYNKLQNMIFVDRQVASYREENTLIIGEKESQVKSEKVIFDEECVINFEIIQMKEGYTYRASLSKSDTGIYEFIMSNDEDEIVISLSTWTGDMNEVIKFSDVNGDGFLDFHFLTASGTMNNEYALYTWDVSEAKYELVESEEMLSYYEVNDGFILNWIKEDTSSGIIQKLVWEGNTLVKESEEIYTNYKCDVHEKIVMEDGVELYRYPYLQISGLSSDNAEKVNNTLENLIDPLINENTVWFSRYQLEVTHISNNYLSIVYKANWDDNNVISRIGFIIDMKTAERVYLDDIIKSSEALSDMMLNYESSSEACDELTIEKIEELVNQVTISEREYLDEVLLQDPLAYEFIKSYITQKRTCYLENGSIVITRDNLPTNDIILELENSNKE